MFSELRYVYVEKWVLFIFINVIHIFQWKHIAAFHEIYVFLAWAESWNM